MLPHPLRNINQIWLKLLCHTLSGGSTVTTRGRSVREWFAQQSTIDMESPLLTVPSRKLSYRFAAAEAAWILRGDNQLAPLLEHAPSFAKFSDDGKTLHGAYGPKIKAQFDAVVSALTSDIHTRQAVVNIWRENPPISRDIPCTLSVQWMIRNETIYCFDTMRSSDLWLGWPYDVFSFSMMTYYLALTLRANGVNVRKIGSLTLTAASSHLYLDDESKVHEVIKAEGNARGETKQFVMPSLDSFASAEDLILWVESIRDGKLDISTLIK